MELRDKLKILEPNFGFDSQQPIQSRRSSIKELIPGESLFNNYGSYFRTISHLPIDYYHGNLPLHSIWEIDSSVYEFIGKESSFRDMDILKTAFIDTETTGLAGGTGIVPFLIGLGFFTQNGFHVEQYFMRDFNEEPAVLEALRERLVHFKYIISYNGKCFDMNVLNSRYTISRIENTAENYPHLDLLFAVRRIWRKRIGDCSLANIEKSILLFQRNNDIPGFMIPGLYFNYLRTGEARPLSAIFQHNQWDIVTLAALTAFAGQVYSDPSKSLNHALDLFSLGKAFESLLQYEEAASCFYKAMTYPLTSREKSELLTSLGYVLKRLGHWNRALEIWETMIEEIEYQLIPFEEIAKYYEHHVYRFKQAIDIVEKGLKRIELMEKIRPEYRYQEDRTDLEYRLRRLKRKMRRSMVNAEATTQS